MTARPYNTALFLLRCLQLGLHPSDLEYFEYGTVLDMIVESANDHEEYDTLATQADFDAF